MSASTTRGHDQFTLHGAEMHFRAMPRIEVVLLCDGRQRAVISGDELPERSSSCWGSVADCVPLSRRLVLLLPFRVRNALASVALENALDDEVEERGHPDRRHECEHIGHDGVHAAIFARPAGHQRGGVLSQPARTVCHGYQDDDAAHRRLPLLGVRVDHRQVGRSLRRVPGLGERGRGRWRPRPPARPRPPSSPRRRASATSTSRRAAARPTGVARVRPRARRRPRARLGRARRRGARGRQVDAAARRRRARGPRRAPRCSTSAARSRQRRCAPAPSASMRWPTPSTSRPRPTSRPCSATSRPARPTCSSSTPCRPSPAPTSRARPATSRRCARSPAQPHPRRPRREASPCSSSAT